MGMDPDSRFRTRFVLIAIILATLPCYCAGLVVVRVARNQSPRTPTPTATISPTWTMTSVFTPTPSQTPLPMPTNTPETPTSTPTAHLASVSAIGRPGLDAGSAGRRPSIAQVNEHRLAPGRALPALIIQGGASTFALTFEQRIVGER